MTALEMISSLKRSLYGKVKSLIDIPFTMKGPEFRPFFIEILSV
jgi:hypothetical protein